MEYKIITGTAQQCQDELNTLRLKYEISIIGMTSSSTDESTTILVTLLGEI